jgi:3-phenylpropionate/trans-cinnamate dioxygenase ferredoxin component
MGWTKVSDANSLKNGDLVSFNYDDSNRKLLIARINGKLYATDGICTHAYAELSNGFLNEEDKTVTCPLHLSAFDLQSGVPRNAPAEIPLKTYQVKEESDGVYVLLE